MKFKSFFYKNYKIFNIFFILLVCWIIYSILHPLLSINCVREESLFMPFMTLGLKVPQDGVLQFFSTSDHCWILHSLFYVITSRYLPQILDIHPQETIVLVSQTFFYFLIMFLVFSLTEGFYKYFTTEKKWYSVTLFSVFIALFYVFKSVDFLWVFTNDCWFYAYIFLSLFPIVLMNDCEYYYVKQVKLSKRQILSLCCLIFFVSVSHEFFRFVLMTALLLGYVANKFIFKSFSVKSLLKDGFIYGGLILLNLLTFIAINYRNWFMSHYYSYSVPEFFSYFGEYFGGYLKYIVWENNYLLVALAIVFAAIAVKKDNKEQNIRFLIYNLSIFIAQNLFMFAIMIGKNDYSFDVMVQHDGLRFLYGLTLMNLILSAFGYIISFKNIFENRKIKYSLYMFFIMVLYVLAATEGALNFGQTIEMGKFFRKNAYIWEKCFLLNGKNSTKQYSYSNASGQVDFSVVYLLETYEVDKDVDDVKVVYICKDTDSHDACTKKMLNFISKKFGYSFTKKELKNLDFDKLYESNKG